MREILFRGKRVDNGDWVHGSFVPDAMEMLNGLDGMDGFIRRYNPESHKTDMFEVERDTVGQYTGLTDKNGVKIFEWDILAFKFEQIGEQKAVVEYSARAHAFLMVPINDFQFAMMNEGEVVGNIHDNPELLKE